MVNHIWFLIDLFPSPFDTQKEQIFPFLLDFDSKINGWSGGFFFFLEKCLFMMKPDEKQLNTAMVFSHLFYVLCWSPVSDVIDIWEHLKKEFFDSLFPLSLFCAVFEFKATRICTPLSLFMIFFIPFIIMLWKFF